MIGRTRAELLHWARRKPRLWWYTKESRQRLPDDPPDWRSSRLPWFAGDEYGRKTLVLPIPFSGEVVWAFWTWTDEDCDESRRQTWEMEQDDNA